MYFNALLATLNARDHLRGEATSLSGNAEAFKMSRIANVHPLDAASVSTDKADLESSDKLYKRDSD